MPSTITDRARSLTRFDLSPRHRPPRTVVVTAVTALCVALSLLADPTDLEARFGIVYLEVMSARSFHLHWHSIVHM